MSRKSPSQLKILNDTLDLMTLMTHTVVFKYFLRELMVVAYIILYLHI